MRKSGLALLLAMAVGAVGACGDDDASVCAQACDKLRECGLCVAQAGDCIPHSQCVSGCESQGWQDEARCGLGVPDCDVNALQACIDGTQPYAASGPSSTSMSRFDAELDASGALELTLSYEAVAASPEPFSFGLFDGDASLLQVFGVEGAPFVRVDTRVESLEPNVAYELRLERTSTMTAMVRFRRHGGETILSEEVAVSGQLHVEHSGRVTVRPNRGAFGKIRE